MSFSQTARDGLDHVFHGILGFPVWTVGPIVVVLLSMVPLLEVRASIPVAMLFYDLHWAPTFVYAFCGSLLIVPLAWMACVTAERVARRVERLRRGLDWLWARTRRKSEKAQKAGKAGLFAIVALPLPGAGAWTAVLTAYVLGMEVRKAFGTILLGVIVECVILIVVVVFFREALAILG